MLNNKIVLITGGAGSFGKKFVEIILRDYPKVKKLIIYSHGESEQYNMQLQYPDTKYPMMRYFIGDVRDVDRLTRACEGVDVIVHAAAIRNVNRFPHEKKKRLPEASSGSLFVVPFVLFRHAQSVP